MSAQNPTDQDPTDQPAPPGRRVTAFEQRLAAVEAAADALGREVRTRRLVVIDDAGQPCIVAEVTGSAVELRLQVGGEPARSDTVSVLVFAVDTPPGLDLAAGAGIQLWRAGCVVAGLAGWTDQL